jgi:hypothetical protein
MLEEKKRLKEKKAMQKRLIGKKRVN